MPTLSATDIHHLVDQGEPQAAMASARRALAGAQGLARGELLLELSRAAVTAGQLQEALRAAAEAREVYEAAGSREGTCDGLLAMASALRAAGDHVSALEALEQTETLARELGEPVRIARVLRTIGVCSSILGRHRHALSCLNEALELVQRHGEPADVQGTQLSLYNAHNRQAGEWPSGHEMALMALQPYVTHWQELADACAAAGNPRVQAMALGNRAITLHQCGHAGQAIRVLLDLVPRYQALGMTPNVAITHNELGRCHETLGDMASARAQFALALQLLRQDGSLDDLQDALEGTSRCEEALGDAAAALRALREVRAVEARKSDDAARAAVARRELRVELARLTSQWARLATQDPLTGLGNRRALERWLAEQQPRAQRGETMSLLLMDLDHFKQINDRFGHDTGDEVLRRVADLIRRHCRSGDLAARYGGEEFLMAMAGVPHAEAVTVGERLRQQVATQDWPALRSGLSVTVSMGVTHAAEAGEPAALLTLADQRLYRAKIEGRNRVVSA